VASLITAALPPDSCALTLHNVYPVANPAYIYEKDGKK